MKILWAVLGGLFLVACLSVLAAYVCFRIVFYIPDRKEDEIGVFTIPEGAAYEPFREQMTSWAAETAAMPHRDVQIRSFDGLTLRGKYYEYPRARPLN